MSQRGGGLVLRSAAARAAIRPPPPEPVRNSRPQPVHEWSATHEEFRQTLRRWLRMEIRHARRSGACYSAAMDIRELWAWVYARAQ